MGCEGVPPIARNLSLLALSKIQPNVAAKPF